MPSACVLHDAALHWLRPWKHNSLRTSLICLPGRRVTRLPVYLPPRRDFYTEESPAGIATRGKQLKDDFKARHKSLQRERSERDSSEKTAKLERWELTVGLEIHAQLNTERKLFSNAETSINAAPNSKVAFFDLAFPGSQPKFQKGTLLPALRAALALNCEIHHESRFDRKHYFYPDQPAGYQITQYYRPYATNGHIVLFGSDGREPSELHNIVGIKQVQLEQDTGKSIVESASTTLIDFNRVGHPLIEIITLPHLHSPQDAAACAKKIFSILQSVNAVNTGMEMGGLRADVNVSISPKGSGKLGQRIEIKNVSSFKGIEQAIVAERDRQIDFLEAGEVIESETRAWTLGNSQTTRLRGKEGEVDYRYMPDPDLHPLFIDKALIDYVHKTLPPSPETIENDLVAESGLSAKDAKTLSTIDDGRRLDFFDNVCEEWLRLLSQSEHVRARSSTGELNLRRDESDRALLTKDMTKTAGNWALHELGGLLSSSSKDFAPDLVPAEVMARILHSLHTRKITGTSAKKLLALAFHDQRTDIEKMIEDGNMTIKRLTSEEYKSLARDVINSHPKEVAAIKKGQLGKIKFLLGRIMQLTDGNGEATKAEGALRAELQLQASQDRPDDLGNTSDTSD